MSPPDNPWQLLGLDPKGASERDVKRAYARLLKIHRPDSDPEGFQKLHAAYQQALDDLGRRASESAEVNDEQCDLVVESIASRSENQSESEFSRPEVPVPAEFHVAADELRNLPRVPTPLEVQRFNKLRTMVRARPDLASAWAEVLSKHFVDRARIAGLTDAPDIILLMNGGAFDLAAEMIRAWRADLSGHRKLTSLGQILSEDPMRLRPELRVPVTRLVAETTAFLLPAVTSMLADSVFRQLSPGEREAAVESLEFRAAAGRLFTRFGVPRRNFWEQVLFDADVNPPDWNQSPAKDELASVTASCPPDWKGWNFIRRVVPDHLLVRARNNSVILQRMNKYRYPKASEEFRRVVLSIVIILVIVLGGFGRCKVSSAAPANVINSP